MPPYSLAQLATLTGAELEGEASYLIDNVAELPTATPTDVSFLANSKYLPHLETTQAGAIFIAPATPRPEGKNYLLHETPSLAFQQIIHLLCQKVSATGFQGIHPTAVLHPTAEVAEGVTVGPYAVLDEGVRIGKGSAIGAHCFLGPHVTLGEECQLFAHVTIRELCRLGNRVILQPGVVIGSCGFGYHTDTQGKHTKLEQAGYVVLEDDVEVGANTTIDRARFHITLIKRGTKIDNLVQIAHNVEIGEDNLLVAQVGIAGSTQTGKNVVIGGQGALVGHIRVPDRTMISARGALSKTMTRPGGKYAGTPGIPLRDYHLQTVHLRNLDKYVQRIKRLEEQVQQLTQKSN